ncbi:hypothetical protein M6B38_294435 [Iris pallida]|uniref:Uncharacterized protein n=1 Tax=Iris pallida TaxID=29817 RepID=A0AAX6DQ33_IRIPA|nr:hypothetical protein M6B38_232925 [Iris pallida]KAJ6843985.1 hypothetical protein M6B38_294435 [Iris pallida]
MFDFIGTLRFLLDRVFGISTRSVLLVISDTETNMSDLGTLTSCIPNQVAQGEFLDELDPRQGCTLLHS